MQIVHIVPGSGGSFYCGNCLRDSTYIKGLKRAGLEVVKVPMYLPIFADEHDIEEIPVFYGAITLYLKHSFPILQKAPQWLDRILNSGPALRFAASMAGSTNAKGLEDMTISMLLGEQGDQKKELDHLVDWIGEHCHADVIHLSNALLLGLARRIKERLNVLVVCTLQDEDVWVNAMDKVFGERTWELMSERAQDVDAFFAVSEFFSKKMQKKLQIPQRKLYTQYIMVNPDDYNYINTKDKIPAIGYISRMCEENGLEVLIDAFILLKKDPSFKDTMLVVTGGKTGDDDKFLRRIRKKIADSSVEEYIDFHKDFEEDGRHEFFKKVSIVSVPVLEGEAFGLYLLESIASGVPVVQPALGAFPEIIELAGGGITYQPNSPKELASSLAILLNDPEQLSELSEAGRNGIIEHFDIQDQTLKMVDLYKNISNQKNSDTNVT